VLPLFIFISLLHFHLCWPILSFFIITIIVVLGGGILEYLQRFLQCVKYIILELTPQFPPLINHLYKVAYGFITGRQGD
jgi:hypothetical protein